MRKLTMLLFSLLAFVGVVRAENVAKIGDVGYATLQDAIDAAILLSGDVEIEISAGTYAVDINLTNDAVTTGDVNARPNITFKATESAEVVLAGTTTLGYRKQNVGASMWNGKVSFNGITFDHAETGKHSLDIQDVKGIFLTNCKVIGEGEYGIGSSASNATPEAAFTSCTFENGAMQASGLLSANLVVDKCVCNDFSFNAQGGTTPGLTIKNSTFNLTLTDAHNNESFYVVRSNANPINIKNTKVNIDSEMTFVAENQLKWALFFARKDSNSPWNIDECELNLTDAAMEQTELLLTKNAATGQNGPGRITITNLTSKSNEIADLVKRTSGYASVNGTDYKDGELDLTKMVAMVDGEYYETLISAIEAVADGGTVTLIKDEVFTATNYSDNGGWRDGIAYSGDKSFTIDLDGHTVSQDGYLNDYLFWFKNVGTKENTITIKNGTLDAGTTAFCALCTASSHENKLTINTEDLNLVNNISNGSTVKIRANSVYNAKSGTKITGKNSYLGIENWNAIVNIYDGTEIYMNGTSSYNGCLVGVGGNGTINVYGGYGKGVKGGFIAMTSGGTINISGGEWIANTDGTIGDNSNLYVLTAQSNSLESGFAGGSYINVTGGTFRGGMDAWVLNNTPEEDADLTISGGNFNANPGRWVTGNSIVSEKDGIYTVAQAVAKIGETCYATLEDAFKAATSGCTIDLKKDITVAKSISINKLVTIDLNGKAISSAEGYVFEVTGGELVLQGEGSIGAICYIINDADYKAADKTFALTENKIYVDIVYNRTFGHTSWQVLYVPFAIPVENMEGFEVYSISNVTDSGVVIEQVVEGDLSANTPYIIKATEAGDKTIKVTGATLSVPVAYEETIGNFTINGTYSSMAIDAESQYVLTNGLWCQLTEKAVTDGNNILGAFRVYLTANGENTSSEVRFVINNSDATAIDELKAENGNVKAEVYDLSGRRVEKAVKGIYVVNGVKVIK